MVNEKEVKEIEEMSKAFARQAKAELPPVEYEELQEKECWIEMPDGVKLFARVTMPKREGKWPVILVRLPYFAVYVSEWIITAQTLAKYGYAVVYNNVRGAIHSEGEWLPFENERRDGRAVIDWIGEQAWCNGNIGTLGGSYMGHVQWSVADYHHPMLKTMFISVYGPHGYNLFYRRGMFRPDIWTGWAATMMEDNRYQWFPQPEEAELRKKAYAIKPQAELGEQIKGHPCNWYKKWVGNVQEKDSYWSTGFWKELEEAVQNIEIPLFLHGGWFDIFLRAQLDTYHKLPECVRKQSCFMIGPWCHAARAGGVLEYPDENRAGTSYIKAALEWFDYQLKGKENVHPLGKVEAYSIGDNCWHILEKTDPASETETFYLNLQGKTKGTLQKKCPEEKQETGYLYDPLKPVESLGGALLFNMKDPLALPGCSTYQPPIGSREDVVSLVSDVLQEELHIMGAIKAFLYVSSSAPATAFSIKVMEVFADGKCVNIADDITDIRWRDEENVIPYQPGDIVELSLKLLEIHWMLKAGSRLRIDISSSNFPAYHVHPNVEEVWSETTKMQVAEQMIYSGVKYPSRIELPIVRGGNSK